MADEFTCAGCKETYLKGWSDEQAAAEYAQTFPGGTDDKAVLCDDCYQAFMRWFHDET